jgi:hypothetical protein
VIIVSREWGYLGLKSRFCQLFVDGAAFFVGELLRYPTVDSAAGDKEEAGDWVWKRRGRVRGHALRELKWCPRNSAIKIQKKREGHEKPGSVPSFMRHGLKSEGCE